MTHRARRRTFLTVLTSLAVLFVLAMLASGEAGASAPATTNDLRTSTPTPTSTLATVEIFNYLTKWGSLGSGNGQFNNPLGVALDSGGNVYVADELNNRIQVFAPVLATVTVSPTITSTRRSPPRRRSPLHRQSHLPRRPIWS